MDKYFAKSKEFLPERWLKSCPVSVDQNRHNFASLPFGYGRRMCLGKRFADLELQTVIAKVIIDDSLDQYIDISQEAINSYY